MGRNPLYAWIPDCAGMTGAAAGFASLYPIFNTTLKHVSTDSTAGCAEGQSPFAFLLFPPRVGDKGG
jgi:hypothetical protein